MNKILTLCRGVSGSGKSSLARNILIDINNKCDDYDRTFNSWAKHFETDMFFDDGHGYHFDPSLLGQAHEWNAREIARFYLVNKGVLKHTCAEHLVAVVSNTFTTKKEIRQLLSRLKELGAQPDIIRIQEPATPWWLKRDVGELIKRNTHGVPPETIMKQLARWQPLPQSEYSLADAIKLVAE